MSRNEISVEAIRYYYRGRVFEAIGELDIAIEEYKKAIEYGADYADVHNALGRVLAKIGYFQEARLEFETALRLNPKYLEAQKNLNELLTKISLLNQKVTPSSLTASSAETAVPSSTSPETKHSSENISTGEKHIYRYKIIRNLITSVAIFLVLLTVAILCYRKFSVPVLPIQKMYSTQLESISAITKFDNKLVLSSWSTQEVIFYKIYEDNLVVFALIKLNKENVIPTSISLSGNLLYIIDGWKKKLYKYIILNNKLNIMKVVDISDTEPIGIAVYKNFVLLFDNKNNSVLVYNRDLTKVVDTIPYVVKNVIAVSSYKNDIWLLDSNYVLYKIENLVQVSKIYKLDFISGKTISAIFLDNKFFWFAEEGKPFLYCYSKNIFQ